LKKVSLKAIAEKTRCDKVQRYENDTRKLKLIFRIAKEILASWKELYCMENTFNLYLQDCRKLYSGNVKLRYHSGKNLRQASHILSIKKGKFLN
jgi:hypothetical protein